MTESMNANLSKANNYLAKAANAIEKEMFDEGIDYSQFAIDVCESLIDNFPAEVDANVYIVSALAYHYNYRAHFSKENVEEAANSIKMAMERIFIGIRACVPDELITDNPEDCIVITSPDREAELYIKKGSPYKDEIFRPLYERALLIGDLGIFLKSMELYDESLTVISDMLLAATQLDEEYHNEETRAQVEEAKQILAESLGPTNLSSNAFDDNSNNYSNNRDDIASSKPTKTDFITSKKVEELIPTIKSYDDLLALLDKINFDSYETRDEDILDEELSALIYITDYYTNHAENSPLAEHEVVAAIYYSVSIVLRICAEYLEQFDCSYSKTTENIEEYREIVESAYESIKSFYELDNETLTYFDTLNALCAYWLYKLRDDRAAKMAYDIWYGYEDLTGLFSKRTLLAMKPIARLLLDNEKYDEAASVLEVCFERVRTEFGENSRVTYEIGTMLCSAYNGMEDFEKAANVIYPLYRNALSYLGVHDTQTLEIGRFTVMSLAGNGQKEKAKDIYKKLRNPHEELFDANGIAMKQYKLLSSLF